MFARSRVRFALVLMTGATFATPLAARAREAPPEKTLSPYFFVENGDASVDRFPLESTQVEVTIAGVIADVSVTQTYTNEGTRPINARYVFPASTRAAVNGLRMTLRDQVIEAEIQERAQAQRTFEAAKREGKTATLLEQQRPNVFTMSVANVLPGDRIEVALRYSELLVPTEGEYEFVFPTVVGPRYASAPSDPGDRWLAVPTLRANEPTPAKLTIRGAIAAGLPLREVGSRTHALQGALDANGVYRFALAESEAQGADRDFTLAYRLAGDAIQAGLSLFESGGESYFLLTAQPPARVTARELPPRELIFIVDVSGSMHGFPLDTVKGLLRPLARQLRSVDRFNVLLFAGGSRTLAPESLPATADNVAAALALVDDERGGGGTELLPALRHALALPHVEGISRTFLVITDGYVDADDAAIDLIANNLGEANVFAFGIGSGVNRHLIEGIARAGQGEPFVVMDPARAAEVAEQFGRYVSSPVLTDVRVRAEGFDAYAPLPRAIPDVLAARPVVVVGKWRGPRTGRVVVTGVSGAGAFEQRFDVASVRPSLENAPLRILWARARVAALSHYGMSTPGGDARGEIVALGLAHKLLTPFTSFVAVTREVRNHRAPGADVDQPLPLPAGVSELAVGVGAEPELGWMAALLAAAAIARGLWRARRVARSAA
jgi:Ca-activated chloride channel family protein